MPLNTIKKEYRIVSYLLRKVSILILALILSVIFFNTKDAFTIDQVISDYHPSAAQAPEKKLMREAREYEAWDLDDVEFHGYVDSQLGYDNNVELDPTRKEDGYSQGSANFEFNYNEIDRLKLITGTDLFGLMYFNHNRNNLINVSPYLGFDYEITPDIISSNRVIYEYFGYPKEKENTFHGLRLTTELRHYLREDVYHEIAYEYLWRWYPKRRNILTSLVQADNNMREGQWRLRYDVGFFGDNLFLRISNQLSANNSNYEFQDYYDWWQYRLRPSIMYFFTDKIYADVAFVYRRIVYKDRIITTSASDKERDNNYLLNASLYYDVNESVTLNCTYTYTENTSNDPFQKYSGSTVTGGFSYNF